jgi:hypothetical protein
MLSLAHEGAEIVEAILGSGRSVSSAVGVYSILPSLQLGIPFSIARDFSMCAGSTCGPFSQRKPARQRLARVAFIALCLIAAGSSTTYGSGPISGQVSGHAHRKATDLDKALSSTSPQNQAEWFHVAYHVDLAGKMAVSGAFEKRVSRYEYKSCRDYLLQSVADESTWGFDDAEVGGHKVGFSVTVPLHGPGTYTLGPDDNGVVSDSSGNEGYIFSYGKREGGSASITINPDGSGRIVFSGWKNPSDESEKGTVTWACK